MAGPLNGATRRVVAVVLGLLGIAVLVDVLVIVLVEDDPDLSGAREALLVIIGALLVLAGAVTIDWRKLRAGHNDHDESPPSSSTGG